MDVANNTIDDDHMIIDHDEEEVDENSGSGGGGGGGGLLQDNMKKHYLQTENGDPLVRQTEVLALTGNLQDQYGNNNNNNNHFDGGYDGGYVDHYVDEPMGHEGLVKRSEPTRSSITSFDFSHYRRNIRLWLICAFVMGFVVGASFVSMIHMHKEGHKDNHKENNNKGNNNSESEDNNKKNENNNNQAEASAAAPISKNGELVAGNTSNGIPYLYCKPSFSSLSQASVDIDSHNGPKTLLQIDVVLLHGASYHIQDWNQSGILQNLCSSPLSLSSVDQNIEHNIAGGNNNNHHLHMISSVTALGLNYRSNHQDLKQTLESLKYTDNIIVDHDKQVEQLYKEYDYHGHHTTLITPASSGGTIVDWVENGDVVDMKRNYVQSWIPLFPIPAIRTTEHPELLQSLVDNNDNNRPEEDFNILAVHCLNDDNGQQLAQKLQDYTDNRTTHIVGIEGQHPMCYLTNSEDFINQVRDFLLS